jgi:hypothetical protein
MAGGSETEALQMLAPILSAGKPDVVTKDAHWADIFAVTSSEPPVARPSPTATPWAPT